MASLGEEVSVEQLLQGFDEKRLTGAFSNYLERVGRAPATRALYERAVEQMAQEISKPLPSLSLLEVDAYLAAWREAFSCRYGRFPAPATYRNRVNALRAFFNWLERFDLLRESDGSLISNPMRWVDTPRVEQRANDWLRPPEDRALLSAPISENDRFVVVLLRWTGLRVSEAVALRVADVDLSRRKETILVRNSKTSAGVRAIPVLPMLHSVLRTRIEVQRRQPDAPILITRNDSAMKPTWVWRVVKRAGFRAGVRVVPCTCDAQGARHVAGCPRTQSGENLSRVTPHTLRRTFGSHLLNSGVRLEVVSKLLGHASTSVTEKAYAELLYETARREVFAALRDARDMLT